MSSTYITVHVNNVRWSFHTNWCQMMDSSQILPSKTSMLNMSSDTTTRFKGDNFAVCGIHRGPDGVNNSAVGDMVTMLPYDEASLATAMLMLAPGNCLLGLGMMSKENQHLESSQSQFQTGWLTPITSKPSEKNEENNNNTSKHVSMNTLHRWKGFLTLNEIESANVIRQALSDSISHDKRSLLGCNDNSLITMIRTSLRTISDILRKKSSCSEKSIDIDMEILFSSTLTSSLSQENKSGYLPVWRVLTPATMGPTGCTVGKSSSLTSYTSPLPVQATFQPVSNMPVVEDLESTFTTIESHVVKDQPKAVSNSTIPFEQGINAKSLMVESDVTFVEELSCSTSEQEHPDTNKTLAMLFGSDVSTKPVETEPNQSIPFAGEVRAAPVSNPNSKSLRPGGSKIGAGGASEGGYKSGAGSTIDYGSSDFVPALVYPNQGNVIKHRYSKEQLLALRPASSSHPDTNKTLAMLFGSDVSTKPVETEPNQSIPFAGEVRPVPVSNPNSTPSSHPDTNKTLAMLFGSDVPSNPSPVTSESQATDNTKATLAMLFGT